MPLLFLGKTGKLAHKMFKAAREANESYDAVLQAFEGFFLRYEQDNILRNYLKHPRILQPAREQKLREVVAELKAPPVIEEVVLTLYHNKLLPKMKLVRRLYTKLVAEARNEVRAAIVSAEPLTEQQYAAIAAKMQKLAPGANLVIEREVNAALVGGFVIRVGNKVQDLSVNTQIERMEVHLKKFFDSNEKAVDRVLRM